LSRCENCVEVLFIRGSASCLECGIVLRRNNFRLQLFEDAGVEKEVDIRRRVLREYGVLIFFVNNNNNNKKKNNNN